MMTASQMVRAPLTEARGRTAAAVASRDRAVRPSRAPRARGQLARLTRHRPMTRPSQLNRLEGVSVEALLPLKRTVMVRPRMALLSHASALAADAEEQAQLLRLRMVKLLVLMASRNHRRLVVKETERLQVMMPLTETRSAHRLPATTSVVRRR